MSAHSARPSVSKVACKFGTAIYLLDLSESNIHPILFKPINFCQCCNLPVTLLSSLLSAVQEQRKVVCLQPFYHSSLQAADKDVKIRDCQSTTNQMQTHTKRLTAREASSEVEKATKPEPLLIPLGSRITYIFNK